MKVTLIAMGVVLAASASSALSQTHYCPDTGHWYEAVVVPSRLGWSAASSAAQLRGGYLASIQSSQENTFVFGLVDSADFWYSPSPASQWGPWLGGYQLPGSLEPDGGWRWVDGTAFTYTNWHSHAPNNSASGIPEETLHFYSTTTQPESWWNDMPDAASDWTVPGYVVEYATATPAQACYLDFSGYTAPAGYGSAEQIAGIVRTG